ncbi:MAG: YihY/virulence factor BrkB family protein [Methylophilales bacterium]|nr:YihY/virulence factor BrkB family protein [Methylophilales bacterium]
MHIDKFRKAADDAKSKLERHRYSTPQFVLRQALSAFDRHNGFGLSASLSFYAMFALIPMALLIFFLLSHFAVSSSYAIVKLSVLISHMMPKYSHRIMIEVYNISKHEAIWGVFGMLALLWVSTPLAGAVRNAFFAIAGVSEPRSFVRRNIEDVFGVLGILALLFLFSFSGLTLEKSLDTFRDLPWLFSLMQWSGSLLASALLITLLSRTFYPGDVRWSHLLIGSLVTASLWSAMRPAFSLFMLINHSYGEVFGGMKNLFLSIGWLYFCIAAFLFGIEVIATLHKRQVLMLRGLFMQVPTDTELYHQGLMEQFGQTYQKNAVVFSAGESNRDMFFVLSGNVVVQQGTTIIRNLSAGDYFGEMALLTGETRTANAYVTSDTAQLVVISPENLEALLLEEPTVSVDFLRKMAVRLQDATVAKKPQ